MFIMKNSYTKKSNVNDNAIIYNKYDQADLEINIYVVKPSTGYFLLPPKDPKGIKVYHILEGKILHITSGQLFNTFDTIVLRAEDDYFLYDIIEECTIYLTAYGDSSYEKTQKNFDVVNNTMDKIQSKDHYTNKHCERVLALAKEMSKVLRLNGRDAYNLITAARYHDLGKIVISNAILNKPTCLSTEEYEIMKSHVQEAVDLLPEHYDEAVAATISQHHERLDGSGYPKGLTASKISEAGKALAVLDTFDAMTTNRVYKQGKTIKEAFKELYDLADIKYDRKYIESLEVIINDEPELIKRLQAL